MLTIRPERLADPAAITEVVAAAFPTPAEAKLVEALRAAGRLSVSLMAEEDGELVGHVALSPVTVGGEIRGLGLAPVAVRPDRQGRGVGKKLITEALAAARSAGAAFVVVLGEPEYYSRFGFLPASGWKLSDEYGGGEAFQAIELTPGVIPASGGVVKYAPEFAVFGGSA